MIRYDDLLGKALPCDPPIAPVIRLSLILRREIIYSSNGSEGDWAVGSLLNCLIAACHCSLSLCLCSVSELQSPCFESLWAAHSPTTDRRVGSLARPASPVAPVRVSLPARQTMMLGQASLTANNFGLTPTETKVLGLLASGATFAKAAKALEMSENTAKTHLDRIFSKTGVSRQTDLIALVIALCRLFIGPSANQQRLGLC